MGWWWLAVAYGLVGTGYWLWMLWAAVQVARKVPRLDRLDPPEPPQWPSLSVLIPACNEEDTLEPAIQKLLQEDYPQLEIVLINDRSTDRTGRIIDQIAGRDARVQAVHITQLPEGWLGKVHALDQGFLRSRGEWVLLMDADVQLRRGTLRRVLAYAEQEHLDYLAAAPKLLAQGWLLRIAITAFLRMFCAMMRVWAVQNPRSRAFLGVGAFNLVRRSALERTEGFAWLRLEVADDVGLGLMMKRAGARSAFLLAPEWIVVEWYRSLADMAQGTEKAFASVAQCSAIRAVVIWLLAAALELAPVATWLLWALAPQGLLRTGLGLLGMGMLVGFVGSLLLLHPPYREPIWTGLLFPLAVPLHGYFMLRSAWLGWRRGGIVWRGTCYPSALLRAYQRVRFPEVFLEQRASEKGPYSEAPTRNAHSGKDRI